MLSILSSNYLARKPIDQAMIKFAKNFNSGQKVLDIGCGNKPYAKYFNCEYIGLDPFNETKADIIADAWDIPCEDNSFDGVVLNQSLEHIKKTNETISEIKRILKPGGIGIITAPQTMKTHSLPMNSKEIKLNNFDKSKIKYWHTDFYRFTKFGLIHLLQDFKIEEIRESNGYFGTIFQLINYFFSSFGIKFVFVPIFLVNNILGYSLDYVLNLLGKTNIGILNKFSDLIYKTLTLNYIVIIKK